MKTFVIHPYVDDVCVVCEHLVDVLMLSCNEPLVVSRVNTFNCYYIIDIVKGSRGSKESCGFSLI